jgi:hypothetical protein
VKLDLFLADGVLDAFELREKIEVPPRAAKFPVGDDFETERLLPFDGRCDAAMQAD